ncbi:UNVERIFIED_CONTAM: Enzymatic polyprotein, partial [Sesamum indicum]
MIGGAFGSPWFRVKTPPIYFHDTGADILLGNNFIQTFARYMQDNQRNLLIFTTNCGSEIQVLRREKAFNRIMPINFRSKRGDFDAKLTHPKMQDKRKFGKVLLSFRQQGLIDSDSSYKESEEEILNLKEALLGMKALDISEESRLSLENVKRLIQRNFSENPLAWWDRNKIEATLKVKDECKYEYVRYKPIQMNMEDKKDMQMIIKEHISLGLIEPGISTYSSPGFLVRNHGEIKRGKPRLVINYQGIFIKDLARYRKDFRPLLKETESSKWKWEEIHTKRVRELKQVCSNLPKLAIPQDRDELVVYTDANDYKWAAVLMKKTTTGEEPCRYTGGLFSEQQAKVWHINEKEFLCEMEASEANSIMLRLRHLRKNLEELDRKFGQLAVNAQVAGQIQRADLDTVQVAIRSSLLASTLLWNDLREPIRKASPSGMTHELREHDPKHAFRVQGSTPVASDSSTDCTRPLPDSSKTATIESQEVQTPVGSSQPSTSGVKEGEISLRPMTGTSKANTNEVISSSAWQDYQYLNQKMSENGMTLEPLLQFILCYRVFRNSQNFRKWISGAVFDSWQNNPHLKRGDVLEIKFVSVAPETAGRGSHPAFHFMKLQRPDMVAFNKIKAASGEAPLVSAISEDSISTRRAWRLWVCLTEMDKVKYPFKIFSNKVNGSFLLNSMTGKSTEFAESLFEKKRMLIWKNKLPATEATRMKTCNMLHVGQWHNHLCPCCEKQEKPLFGTKIR